MAHAMGWAMGGDKEKRAEWHHLQEIAAGFHDHPLHDDRVPDALMRDPEANGWA